jgi:hypothetical protein
MPDRPQTATPDPALGDRLVQDAVAQAGKFMQRVVRRAAHDMPSGAVGNSDAAARAAVREAAGALLRAQDRLCLHYQRQLAAEARPQGRRAPVAPGLSLVSHEAVRAGHEHDRIAEAATAQCAAELAQFDALMAGAGGSLLVRPGANPLRPDVHARSLHQAVDACAVRADLRALWLAHLGSALGIELAQLYATLSRRLRHHHRAREAEFVPASMAHRLAAWSDTRSHA